MAQQADAERIINLTAQRLAGYLGEANKEAAILQEALERTQQELEDAKATIAELRGEDTPKPDLPQATPEQLVAAAAAHAQAEQDRLDQAARDGLETGRKQPAPAGKTK